MTSGSAAEWRRLHPLTVLKELGALAWALIAVFLLDFDTFSVPGDFVDLEAIGAVVVFGYAIVRYLFTAYRITDRALEVRRGVLVKSFQSMPRDRVQSVGTNTGFLGRLAGVTTVEVSAADAEDINLGFVSEADAERLRRVLERHVPAADDGGADPDAEDAPTPLSALGFDGLIRYGLTDTAVLFAVAALILGVTLAIVFRWFVAPLAVVPVLFIPVVGTTSLAGFRSWLEDGRVRSEAGILGKRRSEAPTGRIQLVQVVRPPLRRLKGWETVSIVTGDIAVSNDGMQLAGRVGPLVPAGDWKRLAETMFGPVAIDEPDLRPSSRLTIRRAIVRGMVPVLALAATSLIVASIVDLGWWPAAAVLVLGASVVTIYGWARWRALGHAYDEHHLLVRRGVFTRRLVLVPIHKVQDLTITATFFQRRLGLATVEVDTAGLSGSVLVIDLERARAEELAEHLASVAARIALPDGV
ncbi:MAG TPA: PH domain-containing protein [Acidimicrobiia bacterium]|nr:PH domain-containing protein [Acidimicrobiia bacterium]